MYVRQIFRGSTAPKYLTDVDRQIFWGVYTPEIIHGSMSVKYLGALRLRKN